MSDFAETISAAYATEGAAIDLGRGVHEGALALTAIALWQVTGDGKAVLFEGMALVSLYVVLATLVWFE